MSESAQSESIFRERVEIAAVAIFAAMQANPNWTGSATDQETAIAMAKRLIVGIDASFQQNKTAADNDRDHRALPAHSEEAGRADAPATGREAELSRPISS